MIESPPAWLRRPLPTHHVAGTAPPEPGSPPCLTLASLYTLGPWRGAGIARRRSDGRPTGELQATQAVQPGHWRTLQDLAAPR